MNVCEFVSLGSYVHVCVCETVCALCNKEHIYLHSSLIEMGISCLRVCAVKSITVLANFTSLFVTMTWRLAGRQQYCYRSTEELPFIDCGHCISASGVMHYSWSYSSSLWEQIGSNLWTGRENLGRHRNNELNTPFLPTTTAVAVHLSVSTHVANRSTWQ